MISQSFLWQEVVKVAQTAAMILVLYGWHAMWEVWRAEGKKGNIRPRLLLANIFTLTVVMVRVWSLLRETLSILE